MLINTNSEPSLRTSDLVVRYDTISYRGYEINFLSDPAGVQCFAQWKNKIIDLGLNNLYYKEDMCRFIDRELDLITVFSEFPELQGAKLEWFRNGEFRDIRLTYRGRTIKVWLTIDSTKANIDYIKQESRKLLKNYFYNYETS